MNDLKEKILQGTLKSLETIGIDNLKKVIRNSEEEKREQGLLFCGSTDIPPFGNISRSYLCAGTHCNVKIKDCKDKKQIGSFHTHPHTETSKDIGNLSGEDIYESVSHKHSFSCIGLVENDKSTIKCFIPAFDIDAITVLNTYRAQDEYYRKLREYDVSELKKDGTKKSLNELLEGLSQDKRIILSKTYDKYIEVDDKLYQASKSLAKKLLSREADLIIK